MMALNVASNNDPSPLTVLSKSVYNHLIMIILENYIFIIVTLEGTDCLIEVKGR